MDINHFFVAGINYKKTDTAVRSQFSVCSGVYGSLLCKATQMGLGEVFIISTCNRTEIYGVTDDVNNLIHLLCSETKGSETTFRQTILYQTRI